MSPFCCHFFSILYNKAWGPQKCGPPKSAGPPKARACGICRFCHMVNPILCSELDEWLSLVFTRRKRKHKHKQKYKRKTSCSDF